MSTATASIGTLPIGDDYYVKPSYRLAKDVLNSLVAIGFAADVSGGAIMKALNNPCTVAGNLFNRAKQLADGDWPVVRVPSATLINSSSEKHHKLGGYPDQLTRVMHKAGICHVQDMAGAGRNAKCHALGCRTAFNKGDIAVVIPAYEKEYMLKSYHRYMAWYCPSYKCLIAPRKDDTKNYLIAKWDQRSVERLDHVSDDEIVSLFRMGLLTKPRFE